MKIKILPLVTVMILIISGLNVVAINEDEIESINILKKSDNISFSQATIESKGEYLSVGFKEANTVLNEPGKPLLPVYVKTFRFPYGTKILDVECIPSKIREEIIYGKIEPAPRPLPLNTLKNSLVDDIKENKENSDIYSSSELYPDKWYEYSIGCGLEGNERVVFLNIRCYPVRYLPSEDAIYCIIMLM